MIGRLLASSPKESGGIWPCIAVRDIIEEINSEELTSGFATGIFNKREATIRSLEEGGKQEQELAKQFIHYAQVCEIDWPTTAEVLRKIAGDYEKQAQEIENQMQIFARS